jgi:hypothetical protein
MWRKPVRSNSQGACVEVDSWRKPSFGGSAVSVRDTKQAGEPARTVIEFSAQAWREFTSRLK